MATPFPEAVVQPFERQRSRNPVTPRTKYSEERIQRLNRAGLDHLQISIDNVQPDDVSLKSLKVLDKKLQWLQENAIFHVNINSVIGAGVKNQWDALTVAKRAVELGFSSTVGIIHDGSGQLRPLAEDAQAVFNETRKLGKRSYSRLNGFQKNIALGQPNQWRCRAGSRFLYICEHGLVHYCSQQRGFPGIPLADYTRDDIRREFLTEKACAPNCTISCVHQTSFMDFWRAPQKGESHKVVGTGCECYSHEHGQLVQIGGAAAVQSPL